MPILQEWSPGAGGLGAIWRIDEPEFFFTENFPAPAQIRHARKRIEHVCGRYLLQLLRHDFPLHHIAPDAHDKPRIPGNPHFFSISHSYPYVAAIIAEQECGIDIQTWKESIGPVAHMFLSEEEQRLCADAQMLTLCWAAKEAAYKWWGRRGTDFIRDLTIETLAPKKSGFYSSGDSRIFETRMRCFDQVIALECALGKDFALSYIIRERNQEDD